ncbi:hypothetical protein Aperf_G00000065685 [Anoplocephala perfoliata]
MHEPGSHPTVATSPREREEKEYRHGRRNKTDDKKENVKKGFFARLRCNSSCRNSWKFWTVTLSLLVIICFIGIALWVAWMRSHSGCNYDGVCFQRKEFLPIICYKCSNNPYIKNARKLVPDVVLNSNKSGGSEVVLGGASDVKDPLQELCQEFVNQTALAESKSPSDDVCSNGSFNGCFKMVTKSYRLISNEGRVQLSATIVSRNCVEIPRIVPLGCYKTNGGASMERETCYCKGNYCNAVVKIRGSLLISVPSFLSIHLISYNF